MAITMVVAALSWCAADEVRSLPQRDSSAVGVPLFSPIDPGTSGVDVTNELMESHPMARLYYSGFACGGVVMEDFNGDGRRDLFFTGGAGENRLFLQEEAAFEFREVTKEAGVGGGERWSSGAVAADIDGDADMDLVVCNYDEPPFLFINDGSGVFVDRARECGITQIDPYMMPTVSDYDRDGDLDLFLVSNQLYREGGRPAQPPFETGPDGRPRVKKEFERFYALKPKVGGGYSMDVTGRPDLLLRNDSGGEGLPKFTDVTVGAGVGKKGFGLSATWWDFNNDGWPDLHVGNDFSEPDRLYFNRGDGTFVDIASQAFPHSAWFSMGADTADVNGDGFEDLFCADMAFTTHYKQKVGMGQMGAKQALLESIQPLQVMRNHLFLNTGQGPFREAAQLAGIAKTDWTWGVKFQDLDLDGRKDLFVANGAIRSFNHSDHDADTNSRVGKTVWDLWKDTPPRPEANLAFRNLGDIKFENTAKEWGLDHTGVNHGIACGDLDGDGDPDLVVTGINEPVKIYRNNSISALLTVSLKGRGLNASGVGAVVKLEGEGGETQSSIMRPGNGYLTTSPNELIFGLGGGMKPVRLVVDWPNGTTQTVEGPEAGKRYVIEENGQGKVAEKKLVPIFGAPALFGEIVHREAIVDDFAKQPLLPHKLSQLGKAHSWADVDGDGDLDLYHGGGSGYPGGLYLNEGRGKFVLSEQAELLKDRMREDAASAFFDADGDGDSDLYVASGSYEDAMGAEDLRDRLYLNDGKGNLVAAVLPDLRDVGSCVVPSDVDGDGDLDLFVGSRVIPGEYPLPATSRLLVNESANGEVRFVERTGIFEEVGIVTDAIWVDVDGDEDEDLLVSQEWGAVLLFRNESGKLTKEETGSGLGWWTRLEAADVDGDGDVDVAVGNFGLNTKYHANKEHPALIYYGDLIGGGSPQIIEAEYENDVLFPVRGKSCSTAAMPQLANKFKTFHAFAGSALDEIYPKQGIDSARKFTCDTLESGLLINDGAGVFSFKAFPREVQIAPVQGFVFSDLNGDGHVDLLVAQNFLNPQFETGPYGGGTGVMLAGDGRGGFSPVHPTESGVLLRGDPRGLELEDVDGDGLPDLVCPLNNGPLVWQRRNP